MKPFKYRLFNAKEGGNSSRMMVDDRGNVIGALPFDCAICGEESHYAAGDKWLCSTHWQQLQEMCKH